MGNLEAQFMNELDASIKWDGADCHWPSLLFTVSVPTDYITYLQKSISEAITKNDQNNSRKKGRKGEEGWRR